MDFVRSHLEKMKLWPVEHSWLTFFSRSALICTDLEKKWAKSVQLVRVSFFRSYFLQNPYFSFHDKNEIVHSLSIDIGINDSTKLETILEKKTASKIGVQATPSYNWTMNNSNGGSVSFTNSRWFLYLIFSICYSM